MPPLQSMTWLTANARGRSDCEIASVLGRALSCGLAGQEIFCDDMWQGGKERRRRIIFVFKDEGSQFQLL
jgi:hypothetical protein